MTKANRRKRRRQSMPPYESSEQLRARLEAFALRTRERAIIAARIPFADDRITVLAGPIRRVRSQATEPNSLVAPPVKDTDEPEV